MALIDWDTEQIVLVASRELGDCQGFSVFYNRFAEARVTNLT